MADEASFEGAEIPDAVDPLGFVRALADPVRLRLLGRLVEGPATVDAHAAAVGLTLAALRQHLDHLRALGLLSQDGEGRVALDVAALRRLIRERLAPRPPPPTADDPDEARILAGFVRGGRLDAIPAAPGRRMVVLRWLVGDFDPGVEYPEARVNAILRARHPDAAALRRYLVDAGLLRRKSGIYWRPTEAAPSG